MDEVLSEGIVKKDNEIGGNIPGGNFLDGNFPEGSLMGGNFPGGNFRIFLEPIKTASYIRKFFKYV